MNATFKAKLKPLRYLLLDIDGVLSDGRIFWNPPSGWTRFFHVRDGYGIKLWQRSGRQVGILSGGDSEDVRQRIQSLGITHFALGKEEKLEGLERLRTEWGARFEEIAFIGDDLFDLPVLERVGFSCTVPDAVAAVRARVDYQTQAPGGGGAVREVIDLILEEGLKN